MDHGEPSQSPFEGRPAARCRHEVLTTSRQTVRALSAESKPVRPVRHSMNDAAVPPHRLAIGSQGHQSRALCAAASCA